MADLQMQYRIVVHWEPDHYWAEVLDLPGCFATGFTWDELWETLAESIGLYLSSEERHVEAIFGELPAEPPPPKLRRSKGHIEKPLVELCAV